jgi:hypothetical protein
VDLEDKIISGEKNTWVKVDEKHHRGNDHFLTRFTPHIMCPYLNNMTQYLMEYGYGDIEWV